MSGSSWYIVATSYALRFTYFLKPAGRLHQRKSPFRARSHVFNPPSSEASVIAQDAVTKVGSRRYKNCYCPKSPEASCHYSITLDSSFARNCCECRFVPSPVSQYLLHPIRMSRRWALYVTVKSTSLHLAECPRTSDVRNPQASTPRRARECGSLVASGREARSGTITSLGLWGKGSAD